MQILKDEAILLIEYPANVMLVLMGGEIAPSDLYTRIYAAPLPSDRDLIKLLLPYYTEVYKDGQFEEWHQNMPFDFAQTFEFVLRNTVLVDKEADAIEAVFRDGYLYECNEKNKSPNKNTIETAITALCKLKSPEPYFMLYYGAERAYSELHDICESLLKERKNRIISPLAFSSYVAKGDVYTTIWEMPLYPKVFAYLNAEHLTTAGAVASWKFSELLKKSNFQKSEAANLCAAMRHAGFILVQDFFIYFPYIDDPNAVDMMAMTEQVTGKKAGTYSLKEIITCLRAAMSYISIAHIDATTEKNRLAAIQAMEEAIAVMNAILTLEARMPEQKKTGNHSQPAKSVVQNISETRDKKSILRAIRYEASKGPRDPNAKPDTRGRKPRS